MGRTEEQSTHPRVFVSYSWDDDGHKAWVRRLCTQLRADGVDAILDQWAAVPGDPLPKFMHDQIRLADFVLMICTPGYRAKTDKGAGGVGYEDGVITAEVYLQNNHRKFIPLLREGDWILSAPSWAIGKFYLDFRGSVFPHASYQNLLEVLFGTNQVPPPLGQRRVNLDDSKPSDIAREQSLHGKSEPRANDSRPRVEELYLLSEKWLSDLVMHFVTYGKVMKGEIAYNDALDLTIRSKRDYDARRIPMLIHLYFPELEATFAQIESVRDEANRVLAEHKEAYKQGYVPGREYLELLQPYIQKLIVCGENLRGEIVQLAKSSAI